MPDQSNPDEVLATFARLASCRTTRVQKIGAEQEFVRAGPLQSSSSSDSLVEKHRNWKHLENIEENIQNSVKPAEFYMRITTPAGFLVSGFMVV